LEHVQNMTACHGSFYIWMNVKQFVERLQWIGIKHCLAPIEQRRSIRASLRTNRQRTCRTSRRLESSGALSSSARAAIYIFRFISPMRRQDKTKTSAAKNSQVRVSNREFCGEDMQQKNQKLRTHLTKQRNPPSHSKFLARKEYNTIAGSVFAAIRRDNSFFFF
jgi:hypothetical protein